jgi:hypothetical protein
VLKVDSAARPAALHSGVTTVVLAIITATFDYVTAKLIADAITVQIQELLVVQDTYGHNAHVIRAIGNTLYLIQAALLIKVEDM